MTRPAADLDALAARVVVLLRAVAVLGVRVDHRPPDLRDLDGLRELLDGATHLLHAWSAAHPDSRSAAPLAAEAGLLAVELRTYEVRSRHERMQRLQTALRRLRRAESLDDLADQVPAEVASLGFRRTLFSWVDSGRWVPRAAHTDSGPEEARAIMEAGQPPYWRTGDLLEARMVRERQSLLVRDALGNPHVHLEIQAVMSSHSYVAAPLVTRSMVTGFIHADQSVDDTELDVFDRDLLMIFAEGLAFAVERIELAAELGLVRSRVDRAARALQDLGSPAAGQDLLSGPNVLSGRSGPSDVGEGARATPGWAEVLTRREDEVLRLVADGLANAQIADRLYITPETAKTHVRNALRKLGASNRAEAAAIWRRGKG